MENGKLGRRIFVPLLCAAARTFSPIAIETEKPLGCYRMGEETEKKES
jgi:hypothetical protein